MALPDSITTVSGVQVVWAPIGGTKVLNPVSLANNAGVEGDKIDLYSPQYGYPSYLDIDFQAATVSTVSGVAVELYFAESTNTTPGLANPAGLSGISRTVPSADELKVQTNLVGGLNICQALTTGPQMQKMVYFPTSRAVTPLVVNKTGVSLSATSGNFSLSVIPYYLVVQD